jgi:DNA polymerase III alpha subunit
MGFYAPAQIVRDAREHGVETRAPDVNCSDWDSTLQPGGRAAEHLHELHRAMAPDIRASHAVQLGLREIKGFSEEDARLIMERRGAGYDSVRDLWLRTGLAPRVLARLADADAFGSLGLSRRDALWAAKALGRVGDRDDDLPLFAATGNPAAERIVGREPDVALPAMPPGEEVINDYRFLRLSLRAHPAEFLREDLSRRGILRNETLRSVASGTRVTISGLVTCRQRPGSAKGVVFMTIEDESAVANAIVWPKLFERVRPAVLGARYVAVRGKVQEEAGVIHVLADHIEDLTVLLARLAEHGGDIDALARCDEVRRPVIEHPVQSGRTSRLAKLMQEMPELAGDLDVTARGSAHAPNRRAGVRGV